MNKITYSIIGAGWRAEFYLRIAQLVPDKFSIACIYVRNRAKAVEIESKYSVKIVDSLDALKSIPCDFIVNCINKRDISELSLSLAESCAVLSETPACVSAQQADSLLSRFNSGCRLQIAEQFHLKPMYQATKKIIDSGIIGDANYIEISAAHEYHAMSLIRFFLDCSSRPEIISEVSCIHPIVHSNCRNGEINEKTLKNSPHTIKIYGFQGKTAVYNFESEQYFSPIRTDRILIRGTRGEIENDTVRYFNNDNIFAESKIIQHKSGNLDGLFNGRITFENTVLYESPFGIARLTDEETAIAEVLVKMKEYVETGKEFYSLQRALEDVLYFNQVKE